MRNKSLIAALLLSATLATGCTAKDFFHVTVEDHFKILLDRVEEYCLKGNLVDVVLKYEDGANVAIRLDGKLWAPNRYSEEEKYAVVTFKMPGKDCLVQTTIDGCFTDKCADDEHTYGEGHVSEVNGDTYYECSTCGYILRVKQGE